MAKLYGSVIGSHGPATRTAGRNIRASVQSYNGSIITELEYDNDTNDLMIRVEASTESRNGGTVLFYGTVDEFASKVAGYGYTMKLADVISKVKEG